MQSTPLDSSGQRGLPARRERGRCSAYASHGGIRMRTIIALALLTACGTVDSSTDDFEEATDNVPLPIHNKTWHCTGPQHNTVVHVTIDSADLKIDAVHLDAGCTGTLTVNVDTNSGDGVKIHDGVEQLQLKGAVACSGKSGAVHQDGVQAMGGAHVLIGDTAVPGSFVVNCPTGNNGGVFINEGRGGNSLPTDIVCDHCDLFERNAAVHIGHSESSGVRNSVLHHGTSDSSPPDCIRTEPDAATPIDSNNTCI